MENKHRKSVIIIIAAVLVILAAIYALSDFIIDWMWFGEMGYVSVFFTELLTKVKLGVPAFVLSALIALVFLTADLRY